MENVLQMFIIVCTLFHLLSAFEQDIVSIIGDNVVLKFSANKTSFEDAILNFTPHNDFGERVIVHDGAVVSNIPKYRVEQKTVDSLSMSIDSVHFTEAGRYEYIFNRTIIIAVVQLTVLDPKPNCTLSKRTNGSANISIEYVLLDCIFTYSGSLAPDLTWTEDALIDIGVSSNPCKASEQIIICRIPIRFTHAVQTDTLGNAFDSGSRSVAAKFSDGCNQYKCFWEGESGTTGMVYTIRLDSSRARYLGTVQCIFSPCRILRRTIRSVCKAQEDQVNEQKLQLVGLIGAVTALSLIVVVFGVLLISSCMKNQYLKRRIDFYIDSGHQKLSQNEPTLTPPVNPTDTPENRTQVQLLSVRSIDPPGAYVEMSSNASKTAYEQIRLSTIQPESTAVEPVVLPPMPLPSTGASTKRPHPAPRGHDPRRQDRTMEDSSRSSEPPVSSTDYMKLTQREPLQLPSYAALSKEKRREQADDQDSDSYVNIPKKIRSRSQYANASDLKGASQSMH